VRWDKRDGRGRFLSWGSNVNRDLRGIKADDLGIQ